MKLIDSVEITEETSRDDADPLVDSQGNSLFISPLKIEFIFCYLAIGLS